MHSLLRLLMLLPTCDNLRKDYSSSEEQVQTQTVFLTRQPKVFTEQPPTDRRTVMKQKEQ